MTPVAIKWLLYDLLRKGSTNTEVLVALRDRCVLYEDLVDYIILVHE